jgi:hypothetical protein
MEPLKNVSIDPRKMQATIRPAKGKAIYILKDAVPSLNVGDLAFNPYKRTNSHWTIEVQ